jgi:hypothetical protein
MFPILTFSPKVWIIEMTLSNLEYYTVVGFSSMKSLTLFPGGYDKCY